MKTIIITMFKIDIMSIKKKQTNHVVFYLFLIDCKIAHESK